MGNVNLFVIFATGLLTGGLSCLAVQGGLLAATIAQREEDSLKDKAKSGSVWPILVFLSSKLVAYTLLGLLLGWAGSFFKFSIAVQAIMLVFVALFMIGTALAILNVHPLFRYFIIQPPRFLTRRVRRQAKSRNTFAPALLGAVTVFIPCGVTQAMMALAIASGQPLTGAAILFFFVLGTSPLFFILGYFATKLGDLMHKRFMKVAAFAILLLAVVNINSALVLFGSPVNFSSLVSSASSAVFGDNKNHSQATVSPSQQWTININAAGYEPNYIPVKGGQPVTISLVNNDAYTCAQSFVIPALGIQQIVRPGEQTSFTFTPPTTPQQLSFSCSMGMYRGIIDVQ